MSKFFLKNAPIVLIIIVLSFLFRPWFTFSQVLCKGDCIYFFPDNLESFFSVPLFWNTSPGGSGLGYFALPTLAFSPPSFLLGFLHHFFGFNFEIIEKIVFFFPFLFFSSLGMIFLGRVLKFTKVGIFFATFFYLTNTYILLVVDGGQVGIALAYSLIPLIFGFFLRGLTANNWGSKILAGFLLGTLIFFDLRVGYLVFGLLFLYSLFFSPTIVSFIQSWFLLLVIPFGLHFFWIGPLFLTKFTGLSSFYTQSFQVTFLSWMNLANAMYLFHPYWPQNIFGKTNPVQFQFFFIPFLVFLNLLINRKKKEVIFLILVSLFSIFFIKGLQEPLGTIYSWLFVHFPGFQMFRDPSKFYIPLVFSYSLLLGFAIEGVNRKIKNFSPNLSLIFLSLMFFYFLFLIKPVFLGEMGGTFQPKSLPQDYWEFGQLLFQEKQFSRTLWYPGKREYAYSSPTHPALDASLDLSPLRPLAIFIAGTYDLFSYLGHPTSRHLLDILGVKYLLQAKPVRDYPLSETQIKDKERLLQVLNRTFWLKKVKETENLNIFATSFSPRHFFPVEKTFWVVGSDSLYSILDTFPAFSLKNLGLVFLDELEDFPELSSWQKNQDFLVFNSKEWFDLAFLLAEKKYFILPGRELADRRLPDKSWLVKGPFDFLSWRDVLARKGFGNQDFDFGGGFVFADDYPQTLKLSFSLNNQMKGEFYLRYFSNRKGGKFLVKLDGKLIKSLETFSFQDNFVWENLGPFWLTEGKHTLKLENQQGFNAINAFAFFPPEKMKNWQEKAKEIINQTQAIYFYESAQATKSGGLNFARGGKFAVLGRVPSTKEQNPYWRFLGEVWLKPGENKIKVPPRIEQLVFYPPDLDFREILKSENLPSVKEEFINPTKYLLKVEKSSVPFRLVFSERYHPSWEAKVQQQTFKSLPFYSIINGFAVPQTGDFEMTVEFAPQKWLWFGLVVSLVTLFLTVTFWLYFLKR